MKTLHTYGREKGVIEIRKKILLYVCMCVHVNVGLMHVPEYGSQWSALGITPQMPSMLLIETETLTWP